MTFNEYQELALRTAKEKGSRLMLECSLGLCGEAGETVELIKKHFFHGHELDKQELKKELGDCAWYLAVLAHSAGIDFADVFTGNIEKLKKRYPEGFSSERSINREEYNDKR